MHLEGGLGTPPHRRLGIAQRATQLVVTAEKGVKESLGDRAQADGEQRVAGSGWPELPASGPRSGRANGNVPPGHGAPQLLVLNSVSISRRSETMKDNSQVFCANGFVSGIVSIWALS